MGFKDVLKPNNYCHKPDYKGMTAVFVTELGCRCGIYNMLAFRIDRCNFLFIDPKLVMLEMTLEKTEDKEIRTGEYEGHEVYIGPKIKSIKEVI
jgi:hypothetical protein